MKRIISALAFVLILFTGCQKELSFTNPGTANNNPVTATLQGNVVDENGDPAPGVTITVGTRTVVTDTKGYFRMKDAALDKSVSLVTASKAGYFKAFRVFSASKAVNQVKIKLLKKELRRTLNSATGGSVTLADQSSVTFSANSFSKISGEAYSGTVNVYAVPIDPTNPDISETIPGSLLANDKNNKRVILASYGMMAVELESATGEKLQLSPGNTAYLNFVIPAALRSAAPAELPLWFVDETTGLWKEEGMATKNGNFYGGTVKHFTYWNCDVPGETLNLTARFVNQNNQPLIYTEVIIRPVSGYYSAHGYTDSLGQVNGPVPANMNLVLEVRAPAPCYNIIYSQNIGPFSSNVNLETITVNNTQSILTIHGRVLNCSGNPVTNGFAEIVYENMVRYAQTNASGNFSTSFVTCGTSTGNCMITAVDAQAQQQNTTATIPVTLPVTNAGDITACGTSTIQFINYVLDGVPTNLSSLNPGDTFRATDSSGINHIILISGYRNGQANIFFDFMTNGSPGTFPLAYINVAQINSAFIPPSDVIITQHALMIGEYFEGTFSGQFKDVANNTHTITGSFRVRKQL